MEFLNKIVSFLTGPLNTVAWLYIFLPCAIGGGLYLTIRNRWVQFTKLGYALKNTIGKMFSKQKAGEGRADGHGHQVLRGRALHPLP